MAIHNDWAVSRNCFLHVPSFECLPRFVAKDPAKISLYRSRINNDHFNTRFLRHRRKFTIENGHRFFVTDHFNLAFSLPYDIMEEIE